ncbi:LacI family transcriptional regulator [Megalodesulfovibrio paquesii]
MAAAPELDWLAILRREVAAGSCQAVAAAMGVSRTAVSLLVHGKYTADPARMAAKVLETFTRVHCPHAGVPVSPQECGQRAGAMPTGSPGALRWWRACQGCPHNPLQTNKKPAA